MSVRIYNPSPSAGVPSVPPGSAVRQFTDTFNRANSNGWGSQWMGAPLASNSSGVFMNANIAANFGRFITAGATTVQGFCFPLPLAWMTQVPINQFAEIICAAQAGGTSASLSACVVLSPVTSANNVPFGFYALSWTVLGGVLGINRIIWQAGAIASATVLSNLGGATAVLGDDLKITATINAGTWTLTAFKNGANIGSITDNQLIQGCPGVFASSANAGATTFDLSKFSGGRV